MTDRDVRLGITASSGPSNGLPLSMASVLMRAIGTVYPNTTLADTHLGEALALVIAEQDWLNPEDAPDVEIIEKDDPSTAAFLSSFKHGDVGVSLPEWLAALIIETADGMLEDQPETTNYISMDMLHPAGDRFEWIISRPGRPGPHALRQQAEARLDADNDESVLAMARAMQPGYDKCSKSVQASVRAHVVSMLRRLKEDQVTAG